MVQESQIVKSRTKTYFFLSLGLSSAGNHVSIIVQVKLDHFSGVESERIWELLTEAHCILELPDPTLGA